MVIASQGLLAPPVGAVLQEGLDAAVILNAAVLQEGLDAAVILNALRVR